MALYSVVQGGLVNALDVQQIINLLTGNMNDQQVTVNNRIRASFVGATNSSGYVGGTVSGAPASGTFALGDLITDYTNGTVWICTAAGTPGTWQKAGDYLLSQANAFTAELTAKDFKATGVAALGSPQNSRFVGSWTTSGAPTGLTAAVSDYGFDGNGTLWVCTTAGTPGTWKLAAQVYRARARNTSSTAMTPANTFVKIALDTKDYDPNTNWSTVNNNYTAPVAGFYLIIAKLLAFSVADGVAVIAAIFKNGVELERTDISAGTIDSPQVAVVGVYQLAANDTIDLRGQTTASSTASWNAATQFSALTIHYLSN